ncbi:hypothetical protein P7K49_016777 [Saguinus oedipus]|uniref:Uncharacterized protein n=1 Tax=Saguinus oedipus TaxID=9490 RepID=A0ABQ9VD39_SAGOE|nr:hypothetical protein P7K49_016777 [Saguinus oedipus]
MMNATRPVGDSLLFSKLLLAELDTLNRYLEEQQRNSLLLERKKTEEASSEETTSTTTLQWANEAEHPYSSRECE